MVTTVKDEFIKFLEMEEPPITMLGQALLLFSKCHTAASEVDDLDGEWWDSMPEDARRHMLSGLPLFTLLDVNALIDKYFSVGDVL